MRGDDRYASSRPRDCHSLKSQVKASRYPPDLLRLRLRYPRGMVRSALRYLRCAIPRTRSPLFPVPIRIPPRIRDPGTKRASAPPVRASFPQVGAAGSAGRPPARAPSPSRAAFRMPFRSPSSGPAEQPSHPRNGKGNGGGTQDDRAYPAECSGHGYRGRRPVVCGRRPKLFSCPPPYRVRAYGRAPRGPLSRISGTNSSGAFPPRAH